MHVLVDIRSSDYDVSEQEQSYYLKISKDYNTCGHVISLNASISRHHDDTAIVLCIKAHKMTKLIVLQQSRHHMGNSALFRAHNLSKASTHYDDRLHSDLLILDMTKAIVLHQSKHTNNVLTFMSSD